MSDPAPTAWLISDTAAGNRRQVAALAAACGLDGRWVTLVPRAPWRWLAPRRLPAAGHAFGADFAACLQGSLPSVAIGCGRQAALATRLLHERGCPVVQILDPRIDARHWDLLLLPAHDGRRGANVLETLGSLHPVDDAWLAAGRDTWPGLAALPSPRIALLLGGPTRAAPFTPRDFDALAAIVIGWLREDGGSLLLAASRRTPPWLRDAARRAFAGMTGLQWLDERDGPNPYAGVLGWAERIVVTADSSNMLSEACAVGVPVLSPLPAERRGRLAGLHRSLVEHGCLRPLHPSYTPWPVTPLREMPAIAAAVKERLRLR
jgi:uncharacterized protein